MESLLVIELELMRGSCSNLHACLDKLSAYRLTIYWLYDDHVLLYSFQ